MLSTIHAVRFEKVLLTGSTRPCVFHCEDSEGRPVGDYVTKLRATARSNEIGLQYEFIAWHLAEALQIPHLPAALIHIDQEVADSTDNLDIRGSVGLNFGTRLVVGFNTWLPNDTIPPTLRRTAENIVGFDALIENPDRRYDKSNLLFKGEELFVIDHELAFAFILTIGLDLSIWDEQRLKFLERHPFRARLRNGPLDLSDFEVKLKQLDDEVILGIINTVPPEFGTINDKIPSHLKAARQNVTVITEVIKRLFR